MRTTSSSPSAATAIALIEALQARFVARLEQIGETPMRDIEWLRSEGRSGGGVRFEGTSPAFNNASVNMSHVHYDDDATRPLRSATALSAIVHPAQPKAPSVHIHISWSEVRVPADQGGGERGSWRIMADLNPSLPNDAHRDRFRAAIEKVLVDGAGEAVAAHAFAQGDRYFEIPALQRHRGVVHAYLEGHRTDDVEADKKLAQAVGEVAIDTYCDILAETLAGIAAVDAERKLKKKPVKVDEFELLVQRGYHTVYLFQVLTLDRGTTSGLLVHDENDLGILGSLPAQIDRDLLLSWVPKVPPIMQPLVQEIAGAMRAGVVDTSARLRLAKVVRTFFKANPQALDLQARGDVVPPTVHNHAARTDR